jgi:peptidoglycan/xylan/chitin deacetylase (PgdA/CDA1 family)
MAGFWNGRTVSANLEIASQAMSATTKQKSGDDVIPAGVVPGARQALVRMVLLSAMALLAIAAIPLFSGQWPFMLALHYLTLGLFLYANMRHDCQWLGPVITSFQTEKKEVWLTIDDGPLPGTTPDILKVLERFGAKATFFVVGKRVRAHPELVKSILERGHTLANHSDTHPSATFWALMTNRAEREIEGGAAAIKSATGESNAVFRAPVGMANYFVRASLRARGWPLIGWTARGFDTGSRDPQRVAARILERLRPGGIILMHERDRVGGASTAGSLEAVLTGLRREAYECVIPAREQWRTR